MPAEKTERPGKPKKPPTCDFCKAKRVLCHPAPPGQSCPRCLEKGIECTTTPVVRRKPVRRPKGDSAQPSPEEQLLAPSGGEPIASGSTTPLHQDPQSFLYPSLVINEHHQDESIDASALLSPQLLRSLLHDLPRIPQKHHPLIMTQVNALIVVLKNDKYAFSHLPLPSQAFAACVAALVSLISIDPAILGPGPIPASLESLSDEDVAAFPDFGRRRGPACRALRELAFAKAKDGDVMLSTTAQNAATCYLLDGLAMASGDNSESAQDSRPYIVAYMSHLRTLAETDEAVSPHDGAGWSSFLMEEVMKSIYAQKPIIFTPQDELLLRGDKSTAMDMKQARAALLKASQNERNLVFECVRPYGIEVVKIAQRLESDVSGAFARKQPLHDASVVDIIADLETLEEVQKLVLDRLDSLRPDVIVGIFPPLAIVHTGPSSTFRNPQAIGYILNLVVSFYTMGHSALVYALHAALEERARQPITTAASQSDVRAGERIALLQQQVHGMALNSARQLATAFDCLPSLPHISHFRAIRVDRWAQLLLDAVSSGVFTLEDAAALRSYSRILKLSTFAHAAPDIIQLISAIDLQLQLISSFPALLPPPPVAPFTPFAELDVLASDPTLSMPLLDGALDLDQWFQSAMLSVGVDSSGFLSI